MNQNVLPISKNNKNRQGFNIPEDFANGSKNYHYWSR